jgi:hypothetical protein
LCVLAAAAAAVSFTAQYRMVDTVHLPAIAALKASIPNAAALVFACLGIALALHGRRALRARALNLASVGASAFMNAIAAAPGWRNLASGDCGDRVVAGIACALGVSMVGASRRGPVARDGAGPGLRLGAAQTRASGPALSPAASASPAARARRSCRWSLTGAPFRDRGTGILPGSDPPQRRLCGAADLTEAARHDRDGCGRAGWAHVTQVSALGSLAGMVAGHGGAAPFGVHQAAAPQGRP